MDIQLNRLTQKDLAHLFDKTERCIMRWHQFGLPQHGKGTGCYYVWAEVLPWFVAYQAGLRNGDPAAKLPKVQPCPRPGPNYFLALERMEQALDALRSEVGASFKRRARKTAPRKPRARLAIAHKSKNLS